MPRADAHLHLFADGYGGVTGASPAGGDELVVYERLRERHGIERGLVVGYEGEPAYRGNSEDILRLARSRPWMAPLAYLPVSPPPAQGRVTELARSGAAGCAIYAPDAATGRELAAWPGTVLAELRDQRAVISLNATPDAIAAMAPFVAALDGCAVLFSHLGLPGRFARAAAPAQARERLAPLLALARHPHVAVKLSGLYAISDPPHDFPHAAAGPLVAAVLEAFGPRRLLWGSDFAPALDFVSFAQLADERALDGCSPAETDDVMGGNLLRILDAREG